MTEVMTAALATHPAVHVGLGAVTVSPVEAFEFDGRAVRASCAADPAFGYELTRRFTGVIANRLQATRIRLISRRP